MPHRRYMLDTNIVSQIIRGNSSVQSHLKNAPMESICISAITEAELLRGLAKKPEAKKLHKLVKTFLTRIDILPWDSAPAATYAAFRTACEKCGKSLGTMDMLIASHSIAAGTILVTNDKAFYNTHSHLLLEDWTS